MNKRMITLLSIGLLASFLIQAQSVHTGPYIMYEKDSAVMLSVSGGVLQKQVFLKEDMKKVNVSFPDHPGWNFDVPLQPAIRTQPAEFEQPAKMLVVSDIEGEFDALRSLLIASKVIDERYNWIFGKGHLVYCGDLFDRGTKVVELIWLMYMLEQKAIEKGGYVHIILGNHDIMNLSGNLKYTDSMFMKAAGIMNKDYVELYGPHTELGQWLRSKNVCEKIGDNLFVHAGIAPELNKTGLSLKAINDLCRPFYDQREKVKTANDTIQLLFSSKTAPFWYRGYFKEPLATENDIDRTLQLHKVSRIVVGHTIVPENIGFRYSKKVLAVDVNHHKGHHEAALFKDSKWYKITSNGKCILIN